jgi:DNA polymerase-3 subunit gamma/tau
MTSQSLYRKWRSQKFGELIGQEPITRTLKNALSSGKPAHAYLFTGPRGTGKTSTARLLAKTINCANPKDGEPCNECQQCREITAGNSFNVIEIDAASNRGIDSIRDLREKVMMPPSTGKYKVYVLDEAHMLTTEAFNALLKTLEEPPGYAIFVLATTDVHKMLPTVLSRCQRFDFKRITTRQIVEHLNFVAGQEHIRLERAAAELIARTAAGGMRDALSLLDQAIAYCGEDITQAQVQAMLGVADPRFIARLITYVAALDSSGGLHLIHELSEAGADLRQVNAQVIEYWRALMLAKAGADVATILDLTEDETGDVMQIARQFGLEELTECARTFAQNDLMQKNQGTPQLGLELAFLVCVELHRKSQAPVVAPAPAVQPRTATVQAQPRPVAPQAAPPTRPAADQESRPSAIQKKPAEEVPAALPDWDDLPPLEEDGYVPEPLPAPSKPKAVKDTAASSTDGSALMAEAGAGNAPIPSLTVQQVKDAWEKVKKRTKQRNGLAAATLTQCKVIAVEGTDKEPVVVLHLASEAHYKIVNDRSKDVEWALTTEFGQNCRIRLLPPGQPLPGASPPEAGHRPARANSAIAPQQAARVERPAPMPSEQSETVEREAPVQQIQEEQVSYADSTGSAYSPPLAIMSEVSENITRVSFQETVEQKARHDPVVQEVVRTFMARIIDVRPK